MDVLGSFGLMADYWRHWIEIEKSVDKWKIFIEIPENWDWGYDTWRQLKNVEKIF